MPRSVRADGPYELGRWDAKIVRMGKRRSQPVRGVAPLLLVAALAGACGDGGGSTSPPTTMTTPPTTTTSRAPTTTLATDDAQVRAAFVTFFSGADRDIDKKVSLLQDGERYRQMLVDASADPQFQQLRAQVRAVRFPEDAACAGLGVPSPCAVATFDLLVGDFPALAGHDGAAVKVAGTWKVAAKAWCDVVAIGGATCPA